jgi:hypothetical protein
VVHGTVWELCWIVQLQQACPSPWYPFHVGTIDTMVNSTHIKWGDVGPPYQGGSFEMGSTFVLGGERERVAHEALQGCAELSTLHIKKGTLRHPHTNGPSHQRGCGPR